jgi:acyl carrier protein phosphodiesterase
VDVQKGIILHRAIDTFTDAHPVLDEVLKNCIQDTIIMLVLSLMYDHFLAKNLDYIFK